ncbi:MAG: UMP kinase [Candidatus Aenigmarchaeota archaeon]|nr:UMP kinase [Candidatus Aenigmarchaeota archaeon]MDW8149198.1 UMP kinase [Candidatus Aenigmarchaeota archaeon]
MKIVISLGGSVLTKSLTKKNFEKYANIIKKIARNNKVVVVVGGGSTARIYQKIAKGSRDDLDYIGILSTHLNAKTFSTFFSNCYYIGLKTEREAMKELKRVFDKYNIFILAGYDVGHSTDYDSVIAAKTINADLLINVSNFNGIFDKDPKRYRDAKILDKIDFDGLIKIVKKLKQRPGEYRLFDLKAARVLKEIKIPAIFIGNKPSYILKAVKGEKIGTIVLDYV